MKTTDTARTRAPRGSKIVAAAFMAALSEIPESRQAEVAKAAQAAIRDALKLARDRDRADKAAARAGDVPTRRGRGTAAVRAAA